MRRTIAGPSQFHDIRIWLLPLLLAPHCFRWSKWKPSGGCCPHQDKGISSVSVPYLTASTLHPFHSHSPLVMSIYQFSSFSLQRGINPAQFFGWKNLKVPRLSACDLNRQEIVFVSLPLRPNRYPAGFAPHIQYNDLCLSVFFSFQLLQRVLNFWCPPAGQR